jgi:predicted DNA-binding transcriptional regulator AlpA
MPKKNSAKVPLSGLLGGRSPRRPRNVDHHPGHAGEHHDHHPGHGGLHLGEHHSNRTHSQRREKTDLPQAPKAEEFEFIPGPKLRAKLGISAVTLWRWRHDKEKGFPAPKVINGRLYFALGAVMAWLAGQADGA